MYHCTFITCEVCNKVTKLANDKLFCINLSPWCSCDSFSALERPEPAKLIGFLLQWRRHKIIKTKIIISWHSLVEPWVKDPALSLQWLGSLLWRRFSPWPGNFHMPWAWPKKIYYYVFEIVGTKHRCRDRARTGNA